MHGLVRPETPQEAKELAEELGIEGEVVDREEFEETPDLSSKRDKLKAQVAMMAAGLYGIPSVAFYLLQYFELTTKGREESIFLDFVAGEFSTIDALDEPGLDAYSVEGLEWPPK